MRFADATFGLTGDVLEDVGSVQAEIEELAATSCSGRRGRRRTPRRSTGTPPTPGWSSSADAADGLQFWRTLITAIISAEAWETSLLHWLFYVKSGGFIEMLVSTAGGAQDSRVAAARRSSRTRWPRRSTTCGTAAR